LATPTAQAASQIIADALLAINVIRDGETPSAAMQAQGIRRLNQMMSLWEGEGKNLGYIPVGTVTDVLTVPDAAILGIVNNLAIHMAPSFGATVPAEIVALATMGLSTIDKITAKEVIMDMDLQLPADWPGTFNINTG
jgi:hypothetical protein